jgi:tetratricopeptide (TPR) repeat protein
MKKLHYLLTTVFILSACDFAPTLDKSILEAQRALEKQDYSKAASINDAILNKSFKREIKRKVLYQQGDIYLIHLGQPEKALKYFHQIYNDEVDPYWQVKSLEKIADINFFQIKNYQEAATKYQILAEFKPPLNKHDYYKFQMAKALIESRNYVNAMILLNEISMDSRNQYQYDAFYQKGLINFYSKKWDDAIENFKIFIANSTTKELVVQAKFLIANCYETQEKLREAYNIYYSIIDSYPNMEVIKSRLKSLFERRQNRKR